MFATPRHSRSRRAARFSPAVDSLSARVLPVAPMPTMDPPPEPPPAEIAPIDQEMLDLLAEFDAVCRSGAEDI
ncbi:hypothetical protein [Tautonia sociabilis]|uniref:Uncharacterized protein n=1 Tax=Tautonia sociabilis TaxID=2080755 RepID=A0A432MP41_9BACT|nr:hypothetical protein [Tautonia sociabilis]RUL88876.1 hypothetical protein TsocGM_04505 [Tautonia sociabilis]